MSKSDLHTIYDRFTLKDGVINECVFRNGSICKLKKANESNDLAKVLLEPNQKSNELLMSRNCGQSVTTDERGTFRKVLGADKDKVHHDQAPRNSNDAMFDCRNSFHQSKKKHDCHISVTSVMITTFIVFSPEYIISC